MALSFLGGVLYVLFTLYLTFSLHCDNITTTKLSQNTPEHLTVHHLYKTVDKLLIFSPRSWKLATVHGGGPTPCHMEDLDVGDAVTHMKLVE